MLHLHFYMNIALFYFISIKALHNARKNEIETEVHLHKIAEREYGRLQQEIQRLNKEMKDLEEKRNIYEVSENNI